MQTETPAPPPRRRWFQIHLSTAFMTMLATGAAMTIFFRPTYVRVEAFRMGQMGWPWNSVCKVERVNPWGVTSAEVFGALIPVKPGDYFVSYKPLAADIAVILGVLLAIACIFEVPIRWDEAEKAKRLLKRGKNRESQRLALSAADSAVKPPLLRLSGATIGVAIVATIVLLAVNLIPRGAYGWPWVFWTRFETESSPPMEFLPGPAAADLGVAIWLVAFFMLALELGVRAALEKSAPRAKPRGHPAPAAKSNILQ